MCDWVTMQQKLTQPCKSTIFLKKKKKKGRGIAILLVGSLCTMALPFLPKEVSLSCLQHFSSKDLTVINRGTPQIPREVVRYPYP